MGVGIKEHLQMMEMNQEAYKMKNVEQMESLKVGQQFQKQGIMIKNIYQWKAWKII